MASNDNSISDVPLDFGLIAKQIADDKAVSILVDAIHQKSSNDNVCKEIAAARKKAQKVAEQWFRGNYYRRVQVEILMPKLISDVESRLCEIEEMLNEPASYRS